MTHIGAYRIVRPLARGAFCDAFEATRTMPGLPDCTVTLKTLRHVDRESIARFHRAAHVNAYLNHAHIPAVFEFGESDGTLYMARMFIDGDDVLNGVRNRTRTFNGVVSLCAQIASALDDAHAHGIIHGLVHPRHILVDKGGKAWLIGFGEYPIWGPLSGNPIHWAPEQLEGGATKLPATDVYLLAETALWLLAGRHPFAPERGVDSIAVKQKSEFAQPISVLVPGITSRAVDAFTRALDPNPARRHVSVCDFVEDLADATTERRAWWRQLWQ